VLNSNFLRYCVFFACSAEVPVLECRIAVAKCRIQNPTTRKTSKKTKFYLPSHWHWQLDSVKKIGLGQLDPNVQTKIVRVSSPYR